MSSNSEGPHDESEKRRKSRRGQSQLLIACNACRRSKVKVIPLRSLHLSLSDQCHSVVENDRSADYALARTVTASTMPMPAHHAWPA